MTQKERSEARKVAEQAAEIAARKNLLKQREVKEFSSSIADIFAVDGLPLVAKALKLAKLLENNPQLEAQAEAAKRILEQLSSEEIAKGPHKSLLPPQRQDKEQR